MKNRIEEKDNGYDGYYDDVKPEDYKERRNKAKQDSGLRYKIILVLLGALALIMVAVIIMNLT